jgi:hypothetical protein
MQEFSPNPYALNCDMSSEFLRSIVDVFRSHVEHALDTSLNNSISARARKRTTAFRAPIQSDATWVGDGRLEGDMGLSQDEPMAPRRHTRATNSANESDANTASTLRAGSGRLFARGSPRKW